MEQGHRADGRHEVELRDSRGAGVLVAGPARRDDGGGGGGAHHKRGVVEADHGVGGQREMPARRAPHPRRRRSRGRTHDARHGSGGFLVRVVTVECWSGVEDSGQRSGLLVR